MPQENYAKSAVTKYPSRGVKPDPTEADVSLKINTTVFLSFDLL